MSYDKLLNVTTAWKSSLVRQFLAADILIRYQITKKKQKTIKTQWSLQIILSSFYDDPRPLCSSHVFLSLSKNPHIYRFLPYVQPLGPPVSLSQTAAVLHSYTLLLLCKRLPPT